MKSQNSWFSWVAVSFVLVLAFGLFRMGIVSSPPVETVLSPQSPSSSTGEFLAVHASNDLISPAADWTGGLSGIQTVQFEAGEETGAGSSRAICNQPSHVWVSGAEYPRTVGSTLYLTGVVKPYTTATFGFAHVATGAILGIFTTNPSRSNCVIHHEPEALSTAGWPPGIYNVVGYYTPWELTGSGVWYGTLELVAAGGGSTGGGSGGGSGCWLARQCDDDDFL